MNAENTIKVSVAPAGKLVFRNNYRGRECFYFKSSYHNYLTSNMACCAVICTHSPANSFGLWNSVFGRFPCLYTAPISFQMQLAKPSFPVLANSFNSLLSHPCVVTFSIKKFCFVFLKKLWLQQPSFIYSLLWQNIFFLAFNFNGLLHILNLQGVLHLFFCGCVCVQPPWTPHELWSKRGARPSERSPQGRFPSGRRWRRSCCSWARPQCRDACGQCSSPWSPGWRKDVFSKLSNSLFLSFKEER